MTPTLKATTPPITGAVAVLPSAAQACRKEVAFRDNEVVEIQGLRFDGVGLLVWAFPFFVAGVLSWPCTIGFGCGVGFAQISYMQYLEGYSLPLF